MSEPSQAVFLSYASQDAEAAKRICEALRAAGVEVWFDQSELRGGDAWDQKIRRQIKECALFVPIISANTNARPEGYFRLEWKLAVDRSHLLADDHPFLFPIVIGDVSDAAARVPDKFRDVQWTRLRPDETPSELAGRVARLLGGAAAPASTERRSRAPMSAGRSEARKSGWMRQAWGVVIILLVLVYGLKPLWKPAAAHKTAESTESTVPAEALKLERQARALIDDDPLVVRENFRTAVELCERAVALAPDFGEGWATLARAQLELYGNYNERSDTVVAALRTQVERAVRLAPDSIESALAQAAYDQTIVNGDRDAGLPRYRQRMLALHERAPDDRRIIRELITFGDEVDDGSSIREAIHWTEVANALPGGDAKALVRLAWAYWTQNQFPELIAAVDRSMALQPTSAGYHLKLMVLNTTGDYAAAQALLQQIPPSILQEDRVAALACEIYRASNQPDKALQVLAHNPRELLEEGRFFFPRGSLAGDALLTKGKPRAAELEYRGALDAVEKRMKLTPRNRRLFYWRALLLARLGQRVEAQRQLETAREMGEPFMLDIQVAALLGRNEEVIAFADRWIVKTHSRWPSSLHLFKSDSTFAEVRRDPRFQAVIARGDRWMAEMMGTPVAASGSEASATEPAAVPADDKSVAVLAFANLSDDKANEYFSDGITEELLNVLAKVPGLKVTARTSSFYFKGKDVPIPEIAQKLGVAYVVEGSVRKAGDKVRITAQLIKAADGFHIWSDTFTRDLKDIFAVQDEIAGLIARNLALKIGRTGAESFDGISPEAYQLFLEARQAVVRRTRESYDIAEELLNRAIAISPRFPRAMAALGIVWELRMEIEEREMSYGARNGENHLRIEAKIREALAIDPQTPEAHAAMGLLAWNRWNFDLAIKELQEAIRLNPNYASAHQWLGRVRANQGRLDESLVALQRAAELDPLAPRILDNYARPLAFAGRPREVLAVAERALAIQPGAVQPVSMKALAQADLGDTEGAIATLRDLPDAETLVAYFRPLVLAHCGRMADIERLLREGSLNGFLARFTALVAVGRTQEAMALFNADDVNANKVDFLFFDRVYDPIRKDPKFLAALAQMGVGEMHERAQAWRRAHGQIK